MSVVTDERSSARNSTIGAGADSELDQFMLHVVRANPGETVFHQAVHEVAQSLMPIIRANREYRRGKILERMVTPDRVIQFRVCWVDDAGEVQVNRGYRVQMNSAIGPYKGGLRFHPTVNSGVLKFLAFEQVFKNSLTTLPMGGAKGGSDFNPHGKSDAEVGRFCQAFMDELVRYIGPDIDVPAGDIGVGAREIGFLFGRYRKITQRFNGVLTGKGLGWGGSNLRPEATGYGAVYFAQEMLATRGQSVEGKRAVVSGSGNVAQYTIQKLIQLGAKPMTASDSDGTIVDFDGIDEEKLAFIMDLKNVNRGRIREYTDRFKNSRYMQGQRPWGIAAELAFPSATQNELDGDDAELLVRNGCICVSEGANMPSTPEAQERFIASKILYGPGKAANAGGVSVSGLEMTQNAGCMRRSREDVDQALGRIMKAIHANCVRFGKQPDGFVNYLNGANVAGFIKVADAMLQQGVL